MPLRALTEDEIKLIRDMRHSHRHWKDIAALLHCDVGELRDYGVAVLGEARGGHTNAPVRGKLKRSTYDARQAVFQSAHKYAAAQGKAIDLNALLPSQRAGKE